MKKIIAAAALALTATSAMAMNTTTFQKVYEVPGMNANEIREAFGPEIIDVGADPWSKFSEAMNTATGSGWMNGLTGVKKGNVRCNIQMAKFLPAVHEWYSANIVLQVKNGRARLTVADIPVAGPGAKSCVASIEKWADKKFQLMADNNW